MRLFHVSEESDISEFFPRTPTRDDLDKKLGLVWAIDEDRLPNFLTPRNCPRVTYYVGKDTTAEDKRKFFSSSNVMLAWFISGNEYQAHYYLPMECEVVGEDEYVFNRIYDPLSRGGEDDYVLQWEGGYSFIVNNPKCRTLKITDSNSTKEINIDENAYPFIYYNELLPTAYAFLDAQGNKLY